MTGGGSFLPLPSDLENAGGDPDSHAVQWVGTPGVKGPTWARLPLLTVGMLGTQVVWSVEMGYGECFCYATTTCSHPVYCFAASSHSLHFSLAFPSRTRTVKVMDVARLHGGSPFRSHCPAPHWSLCGPLSVKVWTSSPVHAGRYRCGRVWDDASRVLA